MKLVAGAFGVASFVAIILANTVFIIYTFSYHRKFLFETHGLKLFGDLSSYQVAAWNIRQFLFYQAALDQSFFSPQAVFHLTDVRRLVLIALISGAISLAIAIGLGVILLTNQRSDLMKKILTRVGWSLILFCLVIGLLAATNFGDSFGIFHKLLFRNDLWLFDPADSLIQLYPQFFFELFAKEIMLHILISAVVLLLGLYGRKSLEKTD